MTLIAGKPKKINPKNLIIKMIYDSKNGPKHKTKDGWCCACGYDIAVMEEKIAKAIDGERKRILKWAEKDMGECAKTDFIYQHLSHLNKK